MALRLHDLITIETSTEVTVPGLQTPIPTDIYQAALAASQHDSDGEDPYEQQPKRFMQTEHQKRRNKRELDIRKVAWTLRKMKKSHKANHQRRKEQKRRASSFHELPSELVLKLMQHTHLRNISDLSNSSAINRNIFNANQISIFRGVEIEQFPEWKWLFGDSKQRTSRQRQFLKDAILSENYSKNPGAHGWAYDDELLGLLRMIDTDRFTGMRNVMFLQDMQDRVDVDIQVTESYTGMAIARRTAMCLRCLSFQQPDILKEENRIEDGPLLQALVMPWETRCQLIDEQPARIQAEIRSILSLVVKDQYFSLRAVVVQWVWARQTSDDNQERREKKRKWVSRLVTGLVLQTVIPQWRTDTVGSSPAPDFVWRHSFPYMSVALSDLLEEYYGGSVDVPQEVEEGVQFGRSIGLDVEGLLEGLLAGQHLELSDLDGE